MQHNIGDTVYDKKYNRLGVITKITPNSKGEDCFLIDWSPPEYTELEVYIHGSWIDLYKREYDELCGT